MFSQTLSIWTLGAVLLSLLNSSAADFLVTSTADAGVATLRQAIEQANQQANVGGPDRIHFAIPGSPPYSIRLVSPLPAITQPAILDATTQPGYQGAPLVEINGSNAGVYSSGLVLQTTNCVVRGLAINRFRAAGIRIENGGHHQVQANFIGTDVGGGSGLGNADAGVFIMHSRSNVIGGVDSTNRNVISGNLQAGIYVFECDSVGNAIQGNFIGTTASGWAALGNRTNGIVINNASGTLIGGPSRAARNIISGNGRSGVLLYGACATGNVISGNCIGLDSDGNEALGNTGDGVTIFTASGNTIGGTNDGEGNVISGNRERGLAILGPNARSNLIRGNFIGTDSSGRSALSNHLSGISIANASNNVVGGRAPGARNVISGNGQSGVFITTNGLLNRLEGNFIGVDVSGSNRLGNQFNGIAIQDASDNIIGAGDSSGRNIISGNSQHGVYLAGLGARRNVVSGNFIGTDVHGRAALGNLGSGVQIEAPENVIGVPSGPPKNVISGNHQDGIRLVGATATRNLIQGNFVGIDFSGRRSLGNQRAGVGLSGAPQNLVGGAEPGSGNVISGNGDAGIYLVESGSWGNQVLGNRIGSDAAGSSGLGNYLEGLYLENANTNYIGGLTAASGNLISDNGTRGLLLTNASWNVIQHNRVGTQADGASALGNTFHAIELEAGANNNVIGPANQIAFSKTIYAGVRIRAGSTGNLIQANSIWANGGLGIDLGAYQVTANDVCDSDAGANAQQNYPVLTNAWAGSSTLIRGSLSSAPNRTYRLQFFASAVCDPPGYGEGETYLGESSVSVGASCRADFSVALPATVSAGQRIVATATDPAGNTSEFSACVAAMPLHFRLTRTGPTTWLLSWPGAAGEFRLQQTDRLAEPLSWSWAASLPVWLTNGEWTVSLAPTNGNRFFRLVWP